MKLKITLATATALGLVMGGGAWAQSNEADIVQSGDRNTGSVSQDLGESNTTNFSQYGDDNSVSIDQTGNYNQAGSRVAPETGTGPTLINWMRQSGDDNSITIRQEGNSNQVAGEGGGWQHFLQQGNNNSADITQRKGRSNLVYGIDQIDTTNGSTASNTLTILQEGADFNAYGPLPGGNYDFSHSVIRVVHQTFEGGAQNELDLTQSGGTFGAGHEISEARQNGSGNYGEVTQSDGRNNYLALLSQDGTGNTAELDFIGHDNGTTDFDGAAMDVSGVSQAEVTQYGTGNDVYYSVNTGDNNSFGFTQDGTGNWISGSAEGNDHQIAIYQDGNFNVTDFSQTGAENNAGIEIDGNHNHLNVKQDQSGADGNSMSVSISGNYNNNHPTSPTLDGAAGDARDDHAPGLVQGDLFQEGSNNSLSVEVSSNRNAFATLQNGEDNTISHTVDTGNMNQAVIAQVGSNNTSTTTQSGQGNNIGVSQ